MEAILKFNLDEPDDVVAHMRAVKALDIMLALWDIDQHLRAETKYNESLTGEASDALHQARERLRDAMLERGVSFDELLN